jgi:hypothetical protein
LVAAADINPDVPAHRGVVIHRQGRVAHGDEAVGADVFDQVAEDRTPPA